MLNVAGAMVLVSASNNHGFDAHLRGPSFLIEPSSRVEFSNSSGAWLDCAATGSPPPVIDWSTADGLPVRDISGVRRVLGNGTLVLLPFPAAAYRQDVHSTIYRCVASNSVGKVLSRDVQVSAGETFLLYRLLTLNDIQSCEITNLIKYICFTRFFDLKND